ncbi:hypothetical protein M3Y97_00923900 [Aphelenchoides bicaudatus]|nr:hypothetical protein M3Y97_00923900 [Aphelenchoides bicaudatus]
MGNLCCHRRHRGGRRVSIDHATGGAYIATTFIPVEQSHHHHRHTAHAVPGHHSGHHSAHAVPGHHSGHAGIAHSGHHAGIAHSGHHGGFSGHSGVYIIGVNKVFLKTNTAKTQTKTSTPAALGHSRLCVIRKPKQLD